MNRSLLILVFLVSSATAHGQQWINSPAQSPLPQYSGRYPANELLNTDRTGNHPLTQEPAAGKPSSPTRDIGLAQPGQLLAPNPLDSNAKPAPSPDTSTDSQPLPKSKPTIQRKSKPTPKPTNSSPAATVKQKHPPRHNLRYDIFRDPAYWPVDPRKPNQPCAQGHCDTGCCLDGKTGFRGKPWQPTEPGGCKCGKKHPHKHPQFSVNWPSPFSARRDARRPGSALTHQSCRCKRITDIFDPLVNFKLIDYQRTDNGICGSGRCGVGADPYGCLGESKIAGLQPFTPSSNFFGDHQVR